MFAGSQLQEHWADIATSTPKGTAAHLHQCSAALWFAELHRAPGDWHQWGLWIPAGAQNWERVHGF